MKHNINILYYNIYMKTRKMNNKHLVKSKKRKNRNRRITNKKNKMSKIKRGFSKHYKRGGSAAGQQSPEHKLYMVVVDYLKKYIVSYIKIVQLSSYAATVPVWDDIQPVLKNLHDYNLEIINALHGHAIRDAANIGTNVAEPADTGITALAANPVPNDNKKRSVAIKGYIDHINIIINLTSSVFIHFGLPAVMVQYVQGNAYNAAPAIPAVAPNPANINTYWPAGELIEFGNYIKEIGMELDTVYPFPSSDNFKDAANAANKTKYSSDNSSSVDWLNTIISYQIIRMENVLRIVAAGAGAGAVVVYPPFVAGGNDELEQIFKLISYIEIIFALQNEFSNKNNLTIKLTA